MLCLRAGEAIHGLKPCLGRWLPRIGHSYRHRLLIPPYLVPPWSVHRREWDAVAWGLVCVNTYLLLLYVLQQRTYKVCRAKLTVTLHFSGAIHLTHVCMHELPCYLSSFPILILPNSHSSSLAFRSRCSAGRALSSLALRPSSLSHPPSPCGRRRVSVAVRAHSRDRAHGRWRPHASAPLGSHRRSKRTLQLVSFARA